MNRAMIKRIYISKIDIQQIVRCVTLAVGALSRLLYFFCPLRLRLEFCLARRWCTVGWFNRIIFSLWIFSSNHLGLQTIGLFAFHDTLHQWLRTEVREPNFLGCCFPSKIKKIWCCKPPVPLVGPKNPFPTWNIDLAGYLLKTREKTFSVSNNISCREQVFWANQRYRRLTTS